MRRHEELLVHTGQHYDDELSRVFFEELGIPAPDRELGAGSGTNTEQTARILAALEPVLRRDCGPALALVYGDTNSTLAGALAAAQAGIPVGHVEAGMRSFDRAMPEELNRVLTDHASDLLLCSTQTAVDNLAREGVRGETHLVGDVMADVSLAFREIAAERSTVARATSGSSRGGYLVVTAHRAGNVDRPDRLERLVVGARGAAAAGGVPACTRARARGSRRPACSSASTGVTLAPPLGYLDFLELARHARAILTDSGGVQKEAYLLGVPCVTLRDTTEWVETVEAGWNVLVDLDREAALARCRADARRPSGPSCTAAGGPLERVCDAVVRLHCAPMKIGVVGLGYVGLPLVVAFAEAGHDVVGVDVNARVIASLERRAARTSRTSGRDAPGDLGALPRRRRATPTWRRSTRSSSRCPTPLTPNREPDLQPLIDTGTALGERPPGGPAGRARVDHLPGHDARALRAAAGGVRPRRGARLPPGFLAGAHRSGPHRLHADARPRRSSAA